MLKEQVGHQFVYQIMRVVPRDLRNIVFIVFHSNPIGGYYGLHQTIVSLRLCFFWPKLCTYCTKMIVSCVGCRLANAKICPSRELAWKFPTNAPVTVLHVDRYQVGASVKFAGDKGFLITACGMCTFTIAEPVSKPSAKTYAQALMMIMLRFGLTHTVVLDKDNELHDTFRQSCQLMKLNTHTISQKNNNAMIVKQVNNDLNRGMIFLQVNEHGTVAVSRKSILMLIYTWKLSNIPLTDISRSTVVTGQNFSFPIDFSTEKAVWLTGSRQWAKFFATRQAHLLLYSRDIAILAINETRASHRECMNDLRPDPKVYETGNKVFAGRTVQSNKAKGRVDKAQFAHTGLLEIVCKLHGVSYKIKHCQYGRVDKHHAMDVSPVPPELVAFAPLNGPDTRYGQLYRGISNDAYKAAGIDGFVPHCPFNNMMFKPKAAGDVSFRPLVAAAAPAVYASPSLVEMP